MGYNTTVVVLNDALSSIESDPKFGAKLVAAIRKAGFCPLEPIYVSAGGSVSAARVIECHHSHEEVAVIVGHNTGRVAPAGGERKV